MQNMQPTLPFGTLIQRRYLVQETLGTGSSGAVYVLRDQHNSFNFLVLKEIINLNYGKLKQLTIEAMSLRQLRHPALPRVYNVISEHQRDRIYIIMSYVEGPDVEVLRLQQPEKGFSFPQAMTIMTSIMEADAYLHSQYPPIIHQDIKPTNIIVPTTSDRAELVDYGIDKRYNFDPANKAASSSLTAYEALEQYSGEVGTGTDIYALGATFYTLLTGIVPVDALSRKKQVESEGIDPLELVNRVAPGIASPVAEAIQRAMSLRIEDRFSTVEHFTQALKADPGWKLSPVEQRAFDQALQGNPAGQVLPEPVMVSSTATVGAKQEAVSSVPELGKIKPVLVEEQEDTLPRPSVIMREEAQAVPSSVEKVQAVSSAPVEREEEGRFPPAPLPGQTRNVRSRRLAVLLSLLLIILIAVGVEAILLARQNTTSITPTQTVLHNAASPVQTPSPTQVATASARILAASYNGTIYDLPKNASTKMSLTVVQENQSSISGFFSGLNVIAAFSGTIDASKHIRFTVADQAGSTTLSFDGSMQTDGNLAGSYCTLNKQGQCSGQYGLWSVSPMRLQQ